MFNAAYFMNTIETEMLAENAGKTVGFRQPRVWSYFLGRANLLFLK